jgi:hypothetical protein
LSFPARDHPDDVGKLVTQFGMGVDRILRELGADARHPGSFSVLALTSRAKTVAAAGAPPWYRDTTTRTIGPRKVGHRTADLSAVFQLPDTHALR